MKLISSIRNRFIRKLAKALYGELKYIHGKNNPKSAFQSYTGFKKIGQNSFFWGQKHRITGKENFEIGENVHINDNANIRAEGGVIIGDNTHISRNLVLYSINHDYTGNFLPYDEKMIKKKVIIGKNVWIGMNVCIVPGTTIGDGCIIGMGTTVSGTIPPLSIVGSAKPVIIGKRDDEHYNELDKYKKYGAANGSFYKWSNDFSLEKIGDIYHSRRSISEMIKYNGINAVKKVFMNTSDGNKAFESEFSAYRTFQKYSWCPKLLYSADRTLIIEYFPWDCRLDKTSENLNNNLLAEILWCLLDIYREGFAHCDFHSKNIYVTSEGIKFTDFEAVQAQSTKIDFFESYDINGKNLESPFNTQNRCIMNPSDTALGTVFQIKSIEELKSCLDSKFKKQMLNSSVTFKSLRGGISRHQLKDRNIYASFDLPNTKVSSEISQRNTALRLKKFGVSHKTIRSKRVLDIGSNIGATLLALAKYEPNYMLGLEYDEDKVILSNKLAKYNRIEKLEFIQFDIENPDVFDERFEVVFCLAVLEHLKQKDKLFSLLCKVCYESLYFEGNANSDINYIAEELKKAGFKVVNYLGLSDDEKDSTNNNRPLFIATK